MFDIFRNPNFSLQTSKSKHIMKQKINCCTKCNCIFVKQSKKKTIMLCDGCHEEIVLNRLKQLGMI